MPITQEKRKTIWDRQQNREKKRTHDSIVLSRRRHIDTSSVAVSLKHKADTDKKKRRKIVEASRRINRD